MKWRNQQYREKPDLFDEVRRLRAMSESSKIEPTDAEDIKHYIRVARQLRNEFKVEIAKRNPTRSESECVAAVRARLPLPQSDQNQFGEGEQGVYTSLELVFFLACVAVTGSREGARTLSGIALPLRTPKGLKTHINDVLKGSDIPFE